ncbi:hypothetical protein FQN54_003038 [Arachnomyces sp. PD_36]|nr:hypothetical protein FQN54_003038 [Arachnomyces sp. PD_36]
MQSILQYRHLKQHVKEQLTLGTQKAAALEHRPNAGVERYDSHGVQSDGDFARPRPHDEEESLTGDYHDHDDDEPPELHVAPIGQALGVHIRRRTDGEGGNGTGKVFVVYYMGKDDVTDAHSWTWNKRMMATTIISAIGAVVGFASAIDSAALAQYSKEFGVGDIVGSLTTATYLIGFGFGSLFAGPVSEAMGRNPVYIVTLTIFMIWTMAAGLAPSIESQVIFRFLAGFFGSTPLVCAGGSIADMWSPLEQIYTFPIFAISSFMGPALGPVVGGYVGQSPHISWRWVEWITLLMSGLTLAAVVFLLPESYSPVMLKWKAQHLRALTGDDRYQAKLEIDNSSFTAMLATSLYRPFLLACTEPIIILVAIYLTVVYVILFTFLNGYTFIFTNVYGFSEGLTGLSFLGIAIGIIIAGCFVPLIYRMYKHDLAIAEESGFTSTAPESHLYFALFTAPAIPISLFWMGWTTNPSISPWSPLIASVLFGYGTIGVFISCYQYIISSYDIYSASALTSITFIRYVVAGALVEAAVPWYSALGVHWTLTILGVISALLVPVPFAFYTWGSTIRSKSKYAFA